MLITTLPEDMERGRSSDTEAFLACARVSQPRVSHRSRRHVTARYVRASARDRHLGSARRRRRSGHHHSLFSSSISLSGFEQGIQRRHSAVALFLAYLPERGRMRFHESKQSHWPCCLTSARPLKSHKMAIGQSGVAYACTALACCRGSRPPARSINTSTACPPLSSFARLPSILSSTIYRVLGSRIVRKKTSSPRASRAFQVPIASTNLSTLYDTLRRSLRLPSSPKCSANAPTARAR